MTLTCVKNMTREMYLALIQNDFDRAPGLVESRNVTRLPLNQRRASFGGVEFIGGVAA